MLQRRGRDMGQIVILPRVALGAKLVQYRLHIHRMPDDQGMRDQVEAERLVRLGFLLFAADNPFISHSAPQKRVIKRIFSGLYYGLTEAITMGGLRRQDGASSRSALGEYTMLDIPPAIESPPATYAPANSQSLC